MFIAVARVDVHIPAAESLKDKRRVVQSITTRVRTQFRVAVAEVDALENRHLAVLGFAAVSNESGHAREIMDRVVRYLDGARLDADIGAVEIDVVPW